MRKTLFPTSIVLILLSIVSTTFAQTTQPAAPSTQPALRVVDLRGDDEAIGQQYGKELGQSFRDLDAGYFGKALPPRLHDAAAMAAMLFQTKILPEHLTEIKSLAASSQVPQSEVMFANCFLDLAPMLACSTITLPADASPDHVARFGRNLDFPSFGIADKYTVVIVYHPTGRYAFATIGWPGMLGALSGMNEHGLTLTNMEVMRATFLPKAMPYALLYRTVLEKCKTVDEAIELLKTTPRQSANNLMLMDAAGNRAIAEITPEGVVVRSGQPGVALISTNHQRGEDADTPGRCKRYDSLHDTSHATYGSIDIPSIKSMLHNVQQGKATMQSMIFEPSNRILYLATGVRATEREYVKVDLKKHFEQ